ncbi:NDMA-dependent alcohol dehydrogenase [Geodermatophilaceae bacterium NBWT11]|nr:NDMA-dependent alcohol dehydrogenase [Geodermatophilaceae bacterium NBWT11]
MRNHTRAAVMWESGKPWEIVDLVLDDPKDFEVLVRIEAAGMCHSDDHIRTGDSTVRLPIVGGHEGAGVVEKVGSKVTRTRVGDRVVVAYIPVCGTCRYCSTGRQYLCDKGLHAGTGMMLDETYRFHSGDQDLGGFCATGTFSERLVISENSCVPLPDDISFELGAILGCGVPTGWGSAVNVAGVRSGDVVVVYGCGGIGVNAVQGAAMSGASRVVVVDPVEMKRERAMEFGATHTFATHDEAFDFVRQVTWGRLADHSIITVGVNTEEATSQAISIVGKGGVITVTAVGAMKDDQVKTSGNILLGYGKQIRGSMFGACNYLSDLPRLMDLYREGQLKLDELITNRYSLDDVNVGYDDLLAGRNLRGVITRF